VSTADLIDAVRELARSDEDLPTEARHLVVAALTSDEALARTLAGDAAEDGPDVTAETAEPAPVGAYLSSLTVAGFRGIGPSVKLPLHPGTGLTVIAGRNGSGKSSLAEALEMALTGDSKRWAEKPQVWTSNWRNLHDGSDPMIRLELAQERRGVITIGLDWADGADVDKHQSWVERPGGGRTEGRDALGWSAALQLYRPLLSYDELGGLLDGRPSDLYDELHKLLGLQPIVDGQERLARALKTAAQPGVDAKKLLQQVKSVLAGVDDSRAAEATVLLGKRPPDLSKIEALVTGATPPDASLAALSRIAQISWPSWTDVETAAQQLVDAASQVTAGADREQAILADRAGLLQRALATHDRHGDMDCPVCGQGHLDAGWADAARQSLADEQSASREIRAAEAALDTARQSAKGLLSGWSLPALDLPSLSAAQQAVTEWTSIPDGDAELAEHLRARWSALDAALQRLVSEADQAVIERQDAWSPVALELGGWLSLAKAAAAADPQAKLLKSAAEWLKARAGDLRDERIAPLAEEARKIWAQLRQESNVGLAAVRLEGSKTSRRVELAADVDGAPAGALGVMSQGELHALALALFIPRATSADSPFRFLVLDDPIQAMDPAKVEGFVQVLHQLSEHRQVIVLSHDDRLPEAIRRAELDARLYEISRSSGSVVAVRPGIDPAERYLQDATAIAKDTAVPPATAARIVPSLCRLALEAAAYQRFSDRSRRAGAIWSEVESRWEDAHTLYDRIGLGLFGKTTDLKPWLYDRPAAARAIRMCNAGTHEGDVGGDQEANVRDTRSALRAIRDVTV
jgi:energy-coupling factor transporter ATP-binding protein EcfA2